MRTACTPGFIALLLLAFCIPALAGPQPQTATPVVTAKTQGGTAALHNIFIGSIEFPEVSDVAAEVQGRVNIARFEEGDSIPEGHIMAELDNALSAKELEAAEAQYAQALADLENAKLEFNRINTLYSSKSVSGKEFDEARLTMKALQQKAYSFRADAERLKIEIAKSRIKAPFSGVVLQKHAARGEWVSAGTIVATIARNDVVDAVVEVPQPILPHLKTGREVAVTVLGKSYSGSVTAIIPQGNVTTRTFPVKISIQNSAGLMQGMEAKVSLPSGTEIQAVIVPRDAVINQQGQNLVWIVRDGKAEMLPVTIDAWQGDKVALHGPGLVPEMKVVVKGNERLRQGQPVTINP